MMNAKKIYYLSRSIYRRGARRWRKMYKVNGHIFQVVFFLVFSAYIGATACRIILDFLGGGLSLRGGGRFSTAGISPLLLVFAMGGLWSIGVRLFLCGCLLLKIVTFEIPTPICKLVIVNISAFVPVFHMCMVCWRSNINVRVRVI